MKKKHLNSKKRWSEEEKEFLEDYWGIRTIKYLSTKLKRSQRAIEHKAIQLNLGGAYETGDYLLASDVARMFNCDFCVIKRWFKLGLPYTDRALNQKKMYRIKHQDLINWLKNNQNEWSSTELEMYALGEESDWLKEKRILDKDKIPKNTRKKFTQTEDKIIINLFNMGKRAIDIATELGRSEDSIKHRIKKLRKEEKIGYVNAANTYKKAS